MQLDAVKLCHPNGASVALPPHIVTRPGSPPKDAIFLLTQRIAITWSFKSVKNESSIFTFNFKVISFNYKPSTPCYLEPRRHQC